MDQGMMCNLLSLCNHLWSTHVGTTWENSVNSVKRIKLRNVKGLIEIACWVGLFFYCVIVDIIRWVTLISLRGLFWSRLWDTFNRHKQIEVEKSYTAVNTPQQLRSHNMCSWDVPDNRLECKFLFWKVSQNYSEQFDGKCSFLDNMVVLIGTRCFMYLKMT